MTRKVLVLALVANFGEGTFAGVSLDRCLAEPSSAPPHRKPAPQRRAARQSPNSKRLSRKARPRCRAANSTPRSGVSQSAGRRSRSGAAYANLGVIAMRRKEWDHALSLLQRAEKLEPKMAGIRLDIGLVKYRRGTTPERSRRSLLWFATSRTPSRRATY